jgi:hypothetical protein
MDQTTTPQAPSLRELGERVRRDLGELRGAAERERDQIMGQLRRVVDEHPLASVGVAFGVGYLLSGALLSRTTARLVRLGVRLYVGRFVRDTLGGGIEQAMGIESAAGRPTTF